MRGSSTWAEYALRVDDRFRTSLNWDLLLFKQKLGLEIHQPAVAHKLRDGLGYGNDPVNHNLRHNAMWFTT